MKSQFLNALNERVLVFDGSMGATIQNMDLDVERDYLGRENCVDVLVRSRPDVVQSIHESFLKTGVDAVETDTFGANKLVFSEFDDELVSWTYDINKEAAEIARAACENYSMPDKPRFVIGSLGPGTKLITLGNTTWEVMLDSYTEQAKGLIDGSVDALLVETCQDLLQVKCAINACLDALKSKGKTVEDIPIMASVTIETTGTMLVGSEIAAVASALKNYPIATLGLNCATGPIEMTEHVAYLSKHWDRPISVIPNAGLPVMVEGKTCFPLTPESFTETLLKFIEQYGVNIVGGCCGTQPEHLQMLCDAVGERAPVERQVTPMPAGCTSLYSPVDYVQDTSFLIIGERMNASGSRKFKRLLEEENWDDIISLAREQVREGAHILDINVDYAGRDNAADMADIVKRVVRQVDAPLMLDSTQVKTIEAGLKHAPGKCVINSANFEEGEEKFDQLCQLAKTYGAGLVIGTIDEDKEAAMARTADRKFSIAERAIQRATEANGLDIEDLFIDPLVLPISTGMDSDRRSALELIEGTKRIAEKYPQVQLTCGLSNVSFGLNPASRVVLNSVLLHELTDNGLSSAIVHASKILPLNKIADEHYQAALNLIYDRRAASNGGTGLPEDITDESYDPLQVLIELFKDVEDASGAAQQKKDRTLEDWLRDHIIDGEKQGLHQHLDEALQKYSPLAIINDHLLDGMKVVGELFGSGQMQLPFVLQSAEVMKMAVSYLEPHMEKVEGRSKGKIVLATVKGDVHDIGKNLVDIILSNNGYTVYNLGIKQPISDIVKAYQEHNADAIGMSGLLVKSVNVMEENLKELNEMNIQVPILLGGAALARNYAESYLREIYCGQLYYGADAFDGLRICEHLTQNKLDHIDVEIQERLSKLAAVRERVSLLKSEQETQTDQAPKVIEKVDVPKPPFWGSRIVEDIALDEIYPYINKLALFRGQWGFKSGSMSPEAFEANLKDVVEPIFQRLKAQCRDEGILTPKVVYGYWPCNSDGNDLIIYDPQEHDKEIERFRFPRQEKRDRQCISSFFRDVGEGVKDVVAFHCVTMGDKATEFAQKLFADNEYTEYLYLHGMGVETAEALAELWHKRIRTEMGIDGEDSAKIQELFSQKYRGSRYSFGYPACPNMADQEKLFRLLEPERIGCTLTENYQIDPEQTTSAIIVHHPQAKYFNV